jgi:hypothetical protein
MKLYTNKINTSEGKRFEDFVADFKKQQNIKTASVKTAEQEEADSSGQLDVEPLHQEGESTTMPKAGPSAKKEGKDEKSAASTTDPEAEGKDSGQPKAEGTEKFTNDPEVPSKEEKGGSADAETKVASACEKCECTPCECEGTCDCKSCTAAREAETKTAGELPEALKEHQFKAKDSEEDKEEDKEDKEAKTDEEEKEEKEASSTQFVKIANLDEKNKTFLREYWRQLFGDDYVNAIIADK